MHSGCRTKKTTPPSGRLTALSRLRQIKVYFYLILNAYSLDRSETYMVPSAIVGVV